MKAHLPLDQKDGTDLNGASIVSSFKLMKMIVFEEYDKFRLSIRMEYIRLEYAEFSQS